MLRHYVTNILPNGYKAQVVAYSRLAAVRYVDAFETAKAELLAEAEALPPEDKALDDEALCQRPPEVQALVQAWRYRETLRTIEFAPIISGGNNDDPAWKQWTDGAANETRIKRFKKPLLHADPTEPDPLAFLIVKSMLLTGFDAPIEGVMYLDRPIREAELLQAIARVNRTGHGKRFGIVVDYYGRGAPPEGSAERLRRRGHRRCAAEPEGRSTGAARPAPARGGPVPQPRHRDAGRRGACVELLADERLRAEFTVKLKPFLDSLDVVLPRPEGLPFTKTPSGWPSSTPGPATATRTRRCWARTSAPRCAS